MEANDVRISFFLPTNAISIPIDSFILRRLRNLGYELKQNTRDFMKIYKITKLGTKIYSSY